MKHLSTLIVLIGFWSLAKTESILINNIEIEWTNRGTQTDFVIRTAIDKSIASITSAWLGFGFNSAQNMVKLKYKKNLIL